MLERRIFRRGGIGGRGLCGIRLLAAHIFEEDEQGLGIDGFGDVLVGARADGFDGGGDGAVTGDEEKHGVGLLDFPMFEEVHPRDLTHLKVGEDDVDVFVDVAEGFVGGFRGRHLIACIGQQALKAPPLGDIIFDDKYFDIGRLCRHVFRPP